MRAFKKNPKHVSRFGQHNIVSQIQLSLTFSLLLQWRGNCTHQTAGFDPVWLWKIESSTFYILKNSKDWQLDMRGSRGSQPCTFVSAILFFCSLCCVPIRSLSLNENSFIARFRDRENPGYSTSNHFGGLAHLFRHFI